MQNQIDRSGLGHARVTRAVTSISFEFALSECCLRLFWLGIFIALVLVLRHSTENRSNRAQQTQNQRKQIDYFRRSVEKSYLLLSIAVNCTDRIEEQEANEVQWRKNP